MTPTTALARAELLGTFGDIPGARAALTTAPNAPHDDIERVERASLTVWLGFLETGEADFTPLDTVAVTVVPGSRAELVAAVSRALAETRLRLDRGEDDPLAPLTDVRPRLGPAATWAVIGRGSRTLVRRLLLLGAGARCPPCRCGCCLRPAIGRGGFRRGTMPATTTTERR